MQIIGRIILSYVGDIYKKRYREKNQFLFYRSLEKNFYMLKYNCF